MMLIKSSLFEHSDGTITVQNMVAVEVDINNTNKTVTFKNCAPFTDCISEIDNAQVDNAKNIDVMPKYNLIECSDNYSNSSGSLWQYFNCCWCC